MRELNDPGALGALVDALAYALDPTAHDNAEDPSSPSGHEWAVQRDRARREAKRLAPVMQARLAARPAPTPAEAA